jgi:ketosteroid isomerase-like protein
MMEAETHDLKQKPTTGASAPTEIHRLFADAFNSHDLDALLALYERKAVLVPQPGQRATGQNELREALAGFLASFETISLTTRGIVQQDDIALVYSEFQLRGTGSGGEPVTLEGRGTEVVRRQAYGTWLFALDDPFSTA